MVLSLVVVLSSHDMITRACGRYARSLTACGRELFGFDGDRNRIVLLHGYVKRVGQPASLSDLNQASDYWRDYQETHKISPELPEQFNASHPNPTLDTISDILRALGLQAEIKISPASPEDVPIPIKAKFVPA